MKNSTKKFPKILKNKLCCKHNNIKEKLASEIINSQLSFENLLVTILEFKLVKKIIFDKDQLLAFNSLFNSRTRPKLDKIINIISSKGENDYNAACDILRSKEDIISRKIIENYLI